MLKIPKKYSLLLSMAISVVFFALCIFGAVVMPALSETLIDTKDSIGLQNETTSAGRTFILIMAYVILSDIMLADVLVFRLLCRVGKGLVFTEASTALIRAISWCCIALCLFFAVLGIYFRLALIVAFAAMFLGLCLRVVKNVIEEATEIKSENDMTI